MRSRKRRSNNEERVESKYFKSAESGEVVKTTRHPAVTDDSCGEVVKTTRHPAVTDDSCGEVVKTTRHPAVTDDSCLLEAEGCSNIHNSSNVCESTVVPCYVDAETKKGDGSPTLSSEHLLQIKKQTNDSIDSKSSSEHIDKSYKKLTDKDFVNKSSLTLARSLLGKILTCSDNHVTYSGRIVETEAYIGEIDKTCHTYGGKRTERTKAMYMKEGTAYVYSIYGVYFCLNMTSADLGGAVLIRALEPIEGLEDMQKNRQVKRKSSAPLKKHHLCNGPSKLCQAMKITKDKFNTHDMTSSSTLYVMDDGFVLSEHEIVICKRIGVDGYGEEWANKPYRSYVRGNQSVSVRDKTAEKN